MWSVSIVVDLGTDIERPKVAERGRMPTQRPRLRDLMFFSAICCKAVSRFARMR